MKPKMFKTAFIGTSLVVLLAFVLLMYPVSHSISERSDVARIRNAAIVGYALSRFQFDHNGNLPTNLAELIPNYIEGTEVRYLFPIQTVRANRDKVINSTNLLDEISQDGAFSDVGKRGLPVDMILYVRSNLWPANAIATNIVIVSANFTPNLVSAADVAACLARLSGVST